MPEALKTYLDRLNANGDAYHLHAVLTDGQAVSGASLGVDSVGALIDGGPDTWPVFVPWASLFHLRVEVL